MENQPTPTLLCSSMCLITAFVPCNHSTNRRQVPSIWKKLSIEFQNAAAYKHQMYSCFWGEVAMGLKCRKYTLQLRNMTAGQAPCVLAFILLSQLVAMNSTIINLSYNKQQWIKYHNSYQKYFAIKLEGEISPSLSVISSTKDKTLFYKKIK